MKLFASQFWKTTFVALVIVYVSNTPIVAQAQDISAGKLVYTTPQVAGELSCSAGACHTANPLNNQNKILNAADNPGGIGVALNIVRQMAFLRGKLVTQQFVDLAAYIGNPNAATGSPMALITPDVLVFPETRIGTRATSQSFAISNPGTDPLIVSNVVSDNADFSVSSPCSTIEAGASCDVSVGFTPSAAGSHVGVLTVNHNAAGGTSTVAVSGTGAAPPVLVPGIRATPSSLAFGSVTVGALSAALQVTVTSVGTAPLTLTSFSDTGAAFAVTGGSCAVNMPIAAGGVCTILLRFAPKSVGAQSQIFTITHTASDAAILVNLAGTGRMSTGTNTTKTMVEYFYSPLNYYFMTSRDDYKAALDKIADFQRTGLSFPVYATEVANSKALSRFYFDQIAMSASRGSHFYTLLDDDKAALVAQNPGNAQTPRLPYNEGIDSWAFLPIVSGPGGACASGQTPVYRLFRGGARFPDDPNHRYTTSTSVYNAFVSLGWDGEGVNFCVPSP